MAMMVISSIFLTKPIGTHALTHQVNLPEIDNQYLQKANYSQIAKARARQQAAYQHRVAMLTPQNKQSLASSTSRFVSGTGFFVDDHYIVTNNHVVQACDHIRIRGAVKPAYAEIYASDKENDLALLRTNRKSPSIAKLKKESALDVGENVIVMGYPLEHGVRGDYLLKQASITNVGDDYYQSNRIQFTDSVEKGNSGGPLIDRYGAVIGVIVGKMNFYLTNGSSNDLAKPIKTSSIAINLDTLKTFLNHQRIRYQTTANHSLAYQEIQTESQAKNYIVNIHCVKTPVEEAGDTPVFPSNEVALVR